EVEERLVLVALDDDGHALRHRTRTAIALDADVGGRETVDDGVARARCVAVDDEVLRLAVCCAARRRGRQVACADARSLRERLVRVEEATELCVAPKRTSRTGSTIANSTSCVPRSERAK